MFKYFVLRDSDENVKHIEEFIIFFNFICSFFF